MPTLPEILQRGWRVHQAGDLPGAERIYRGVLEQVSENPEALTYLGIALFDQRRFAESVDAYRQAIVARDVFPIAWNNLGNSLRMLGRVEEAEAAFIKSLDQDPTYLSAFKNRGTLWVWTGEVQRGMKWYEEGLKIDPNNAELHRNLGVIYLLLGDYQRGWEEYRWRWAMPGMYRANCGAPIWQGERIAGKSILLYPEQGRGDAVQFIRMAKVLSEAGGHVVVQCDEKMIPLFTSAAGITTLLPYEAASPAVDYHASFIDAVDVWYTTHGVMPYAIDANDPGYLTVSDPLIDYWKNWLDTHVPSNAKSQLSSALTRGPSGRSLRVGINWQGNREHHADIYRSLPLAELEPLSKLRHVQLINLQFGDGVEQLEHVSFADQIHRLPDDVDTTDGAFTDTAAILQNLDAVVTSDTALAHLAGSVGTATHVLLGRVPDWRWLIEGDRTPWYPTMQLHRQKEIGDWSGVIQSCCQSLQS